MIAIFFFHHWLRFFYLKLRECVAFRSKYCMKRLCFSDSIHIHWPPLRGPSGGQARIRIEDPQWIFLLEELSALIQDPVVDKGSGRVVPCLDEPAGDALRQLVIKYFNESRSASSLRTFV